MSVEYTPINYFCNRGLHSLDLGRKIRPEVCFVVHADESGSGPVASVGQIGNGKAGQLEGCVDLLSRTKPTSYRNSRDGGSHAHRSTFHNQERKF